MGQDKDGGAPPLNLRRAPALKDQAATPAPPAPMTEQSAAAQPMRVDAAEVADSERARSEADERAEAIRRNMPDHDEADHR
jgi:hypothetical protein